MADSPRAIRAWLTGMRQMNAVVWREAREASVESRFRDLDSLHGAFSPFPPDPLREDAARRVQDRWLRIRKSLRARP